MQTLHKLKLTIIIVLLVKECKRIPREPGKIALKQNNGDCIKGKLHIQFKSDLMTAHGELVMLTQTQHVSQ